MTERAPSGIQINFADFCPLLKKQALKNPPSLFFMPDTAIASETHCPEGGLPGVELRSDSGYLVVVNPDSTVVYCSGCPKLKQGFEEKIDDAS